MDRSISYFRFDAHAGSFVTEKVPCPVFRPSGPVAIYSQTSSIHDTLLFVVACAEHGRALLQAVKKSSLFLPVFPFKPNLSWVGQIWHCLERLFKGAGIKANLSHLQPTVHLLTQIILPRYGDTLFQLVVFVEASLCCGGQCKTSSKRPPYRWLELEEITAVSSELCGPEPFLYLIGAQEPMRCQELSIESELNSSSKKWALVASTGYTEADLAHLFSEFLQQSFPSRFLNQGLFIDYLKRSQISLNVHSKVHHATRLFSAFCVSNSAYSTFRDFVFALVGLERKCQHGGIGGELRARCIFRFYSSVGTSEMTFHELVELFEDIADNQRSRNKPVEMEPEKSAEAVFESLEKPQDGTISQDKFVDLVGTLSIRGTATLYRTNQSPLQEFRSKHLYESVWSCISETPIERIYSRKKLAKQRKRFCRSCAKSKYTLAVHSFIIADKNETWYTQETAELCTKGRPLGDPSLEALSPENMANTLRDVIRTYSATYFGFPRLPPTTERTLKWERKEDRFSLVSGIFKLCLEAREAFRRGPRVARAISPVFVFGDIHGNLRDLMIYDHLLWRNAPAGFTPMSCFMGDYVDRGEHSVECILYLLAMKTLLPERFHLTRGNHEIRYIQQQFTFARECQDKFGVTTGNNIWEALNQVFDCMPLCSVIDDAIYCAHGGIPSSVYQIESLLSIPVPLPSPLLSKCAWEVLWNDPASKEEFDSAAMMGPRITANWFPATPHGCLPNTKRGTAYFYGAQASELFLDHNGLSLCLRAHEVIDDGFTFHHDGRVLTIFSSSNYCSTQNLAAMVFVNGGKARILQIETTEKFKSK